MNKRTSATYIALATLLGLSLACIDSTPTTQSPSSTLKPAATLEQKPETETPRQPTFEENLQNDMFPSGIIYACLKTDYDIVYIQSLIGYFEPVTLSNRIAATNFTRAAGGKLNPVDELNKYLINKGFTEKYSVDDFMFAFFPDSLIDRNDFYSAGKCAPIFGTDDLKRTYSEIPSP